MLLQAFTPLHAEPTGQRLQTLVPPGFAIGGVLHGYDYNDSFTYEPYRKIAVDEFNAVTVSAYMPWGVWENPAQQPVTDGLTRITDWAVDRGKRVHGHALVYPYANTHLPWFQALDSAEVDGTLKRYVQTMASSTRGKMWVWDVVNEVIGDTYNIQNNSGVDDAGVRTGIEIDGNFVDFPEYRAMGREYISKAFYWADQADPEAQLIINDYAIAEINPKSDALFKFAVDLKARGVPIDGIGFQMGDDNGTGLALGTYRLTSSWDSTSSWLGCAGMPNGLGGWEPDNQIGLFPLNNESLQWGSLKWTLETAPANITGNRATSNAVRLRNVWASGSGYLSRDAAFDRPGWTPGTGVGLLPADDDAIGQLWLLEPYSLGRYRIKSYAESEGAVYLTRDGLALENGGYLPGQTVNLYSDEGWSSQVWELDRVEANQP